MNTKSWIVMVIVGGVLVVGGLVVSSTPEAEVNVSVAAGYQGKAEVAVDPADPLALVVAGADDGGSGPTAWSSIDGGASYSSSALPLLFDGHTFAEGSEPAVAVDRNGIWYAAYEVHDLDGGLNPIDSSLVMARSFDGLVWEVASIVEDNRGAGASPAVETPHIAVDSSPSGCTSYSDRLHVVWLRKTGTDRAVYRNYSTTDGASWTSSVKVNDGVSGTEDLWRPRVAVGPDGQVYVAWLDDVLGTIEVDEATNGGHTFGTDVSAATVNVGCDAGDCGRDLGCSGGALHGSTPALAVDTSWTASRGTVYVGFADEIVPADGMDVRVTASTDGGGTWSPPVQVHSVAGEQQYGPALAVHLVDGSVHAAWYDRRNDAVTDCDTETWHAVSTDGGATWSDETAVSSLASDYTGDTRGEGAHLSIATGSGKVYPVWTDNRTSTNHEIYLGRIARAGGTVIPGGNISSNTTWLAADGPYIVTADLTIDTGATLTLEAGTEIRMATCDALNTGVDSSRIEIIVEGILDAAGASGNEVVFRSGDPAPAKSDWYGIRFQNTADSSDSTLTFTDIRHTRYGIRLTNSSPTLEDVAVELATTNGIQGSARTAVPFSPTRVTVSDAGTPVALTDVSGTWTDVTLENSSGDAGTITGGSLDLRMVGLRVLNNASGGLDVSLSGGGLEVILSEFNGNGVGEAGLTLNGTGPRTLVANDFQGNADDGLELSSTTSGWPVVGVYFSNFDGNSGAALRMISGSLPADARRNWWGALNAEMTAYPKNISGIWDVHDDTVLRHVDFREKAGSAVANDTDLQSYLAVPTSMNDNETVIYGGAVAREGILKVEVSTDGGSSWSDATVEGAAFSMVWAPTPGTYNVMSRVTDTGMNVEVAPDLVVVTVSAGPTLSGTLLANETWTGPGTIVLEGDVVIPEGVTLTIDPGTTLHAQYLTDSAYGGLDPSRIEIIVEGVLQSNGAVGTEVVWDSSRAGGGAKGDWYGIRYLDTTTDEQSNLTSTEIGHAVNGVKLESAAPDIIDSTIAECSQDGLTGSSGALSKALWILSGNTIQNNDGDGVDVTGSTEVEVIGAMVTGNGGRGMRIDASPNLVTVTGATVSSNGDDGLWISSGNTGFNLLDSTIATNGGDGVHVSSGGTDVRLERLTVSGNVEDGIHVSGGTNVVLLKSSVTGNERGLNIGSPRIIAAYNTITGNTGDLVAGFQGTGVYYSSGSGVPAVLEMSDIDNSVDYEAYLTTSRALRARRNYWGAATTANMNGAGFPADRAEFRDIHENRGVGVVDYDNWAAASVAGSAPGNLAAHVTWPGDGDSLDVSSVIVTGVAYALDGIDRVEVCVREQGVDPVCGDGGGETPFGVVTGKESWTFEWFPPSSGTFELQARVVDTGDVKSVPAETITYTVNVLGATVSGPVAISGPVIGDQTWSGAIELTGDVVVEAGNTLTLAAGTTVEARALVDDRFGGEDTSRIELIVRGNLVTQGTGGSPVSFSSTRVVPEKRDWYGIRFESISDASLNDMDWTSVDAGWHGIEFRDTFSTLDEVSCSNNHQDGLYLSSSTAAFPAIAAINGGSFLNNGRYGVHLRSIDGTWLVDGVEAGDNGSYGMYVFGCNGDGPLTLDTVDVHGNASYGTYLYNCYRPVSVLTSNFDGNLGTGFYASGASPMVVRANTFTNQTTIGLSLSNPSELIMSKNTFTGNEANTLVSGASGQTKIVFNEFGPWTNLGNENVEFTGGGAATFRNVHLNNFREFAPVTADVILRNDVASSVNARVNYWDPDTTNEMTINPFPSDITSIEDVEDNPAWGRVDWRAHRGSAVNLAPAQVCGFTNPVEGDVLTGTTFSLQGAAAADAAIQLVEISTDGGSTWNPAVGEELWSYEWTPPGSAMYTLQCRVTDLDAVTQAAPTSINVDVIAAAITTTGTLTTDETWPTGIIILTGDVTVPNGITLTIEEGTTVKATPQSDDQFGGVDTSKIELIIEGKLVLQGTGVSPVTFTSNRTLPAVPTAGDWYGIRLLDSADSTVSIHDAVIEAAVRGIWGYPGSHHDVLDCTVRDMTEDGIWMQFGNSARDVLDPGIEISGNTVERTGSSDYGIYLARSGSLASWNDAVHDVSNNTTNDTGSTGIRLAAGNLERLEVMTNVVSDAATGIYLAGSNSTSYTNRMEAIGNQVADASSWGVHVQTGLSVLLEGNTITGGGSGIYNYIVREDRIVNNTLSGGLYDGIFLNGSGSSDSYVHRNSVTGYGRDGLVTSYLSTLVALYNTLDTSGGDAIQLSSSTVHRVHWNNIQGSGAYDLNLGSATGADLKHNYWDATNGELIAEGYPSEISKIYDIDDNNARGRVDYRGVEIAAVGAPGARESRLVWPFDGDAMSRRTITLEGTAYADAGVQLVEVSTDGGTSWLPASGADFWTYSFTPTVDGPQTFLCRVTDNDAIVEATPDAITVTFDSSLPTTEGTLPGDETWTGPTPILLTGDVIVPAGTTLTLDPGTIIEVQPLADNSRGGVDLSRIELIVEGALDLQGTGASPVTYTSSRTPTPLPGDWYGIRITDTADSDFTIHDLVVEFGVRGIWGYPGSHQDVVDTTVRDMTRDGIYMQFGNSVRDGADPGMLISGNTVERVGGSSYHGIYLARTGSLSSWNTAVHQVIGNTADDVGSRGLSLAFGNSERLEVTANTVSNSSTGIYVSGSNSTSYTNRVEMTGNQVSGASSWGLYQHTGRSVLIENNTITGGNSGIYTYVVREGRIIRNTLDSGTGTGINVGSSGGNSDMYVHRNTITGYGGDGIVTSSLGNMIALYNTITNVGGDATDISTLNAASVPRIHWNNIQGSTAYDVHLRSTTGADLRRNFWSGTNAEMLAEGYPAEISEIYDIDNNTARGRIDYRGVEDPAIDTNVTLESRFVWPFDGDVMSSRTLTIEGTAYAEAEVQLVEVSTDGGSTWQPASGADFWTFSFTPTVDGLQTFQCRVTDVNSNVELTPDAITVTFNSALPTTEGTIPANESWSGTVVLTGDVIVPAGMTLTLDPGTTVQVQALADNSRGGVDWSRIELIVEGDLVAQGVGPGSIQMTSESITPAKGHWYGIRYAGTARPLSELRNLSLEWGKKGISDSNSVGIPDLDGIAIQQMQQEGIHASIAPMGTGVWTFRNIDISLVDYAGLRVNTGAVEADVLLDNVTITDVGRQAVDLDGTNTETMELRSSTFDTSSSSNTVELTGAHDMRVEGVTIHHSSASGNALHVSSSHIGDTLTLNDSEITGGSRTVYIYRVTNPTITRSRITDGATGVYLGGSSTWTVDAVLENNRISDTTLDGVHVANYADATLHYNDLYNIGGYALNNQSPDDIDAADNYWGEDTETEMNVKGCDANIDAIYDQRDNGSKGLVTYCDYATEPFGDQPTLYFHDNSGQYEIHWNTKGALTYDLIRGDIANLAINVNTVDLGAVTCEQQADGSGIITDTSGDPAAGQAWFYVLRDHVTPGNYGQDSSGRERVPASGDCP